jgi:hypothetical protein
MISEPNYFDGNDAYTVYDLLAWISNGCNLKIGVESTT